MAVPSAGLICSLPCAMVDCVSCHEAWGQSWASRDVLWIGLIRSFQGGFEELLGKQTSCPCGGIPHSSALSLRKAPKGIRQLFGTWGITNMLPVSLSVLPGAAGEVLCLAAVAKQLTVHKLKLIPGK